MSTSFSLTTVLMMALLRGISAQPLTGRVVEDRAGTAVPSADVRIYKDGIRTLAADLETDVEGRFSADGLSAGDYRAEISKANHINTTVRFQIASGGQVSLAVRIVRCGVISGQVVDGAGKAIRGVHVFAMRAGNGPLRRELAAGRYSSVDDRGRYRLYNLPPGQYIVAVTYGASTTAMGSTGSAATPANFGSGALFYPSNARPEPFTIAGGEEFRGTDFLVLTPNLFSVGGKVQMAEPGPANARFWVALTSTEQPSLALAVTTASADGGFRLTGVPPGSYHVFASGPTGARSTMGAELGQEALFARASVTVGAQNLEDLILLPQNGPSVSFTLTAPSGCSASAEIAVLALEDWGASLDRRTPIVPGKSSAVLSLAPSRYRVAVSGLGDACYVPEDLPLNLSSSPPSAPIALKAVPAGAIRGRLQTSGPMSPFLVVLADLTDRTQPLRVAAPGASASFSFTGLRPGRYRVSAKRTDSVRARWVDESPGQLEIDVPGGATVDATVVGPPAEELKP